MDNQAFVNRPDPLENPAVSVIIPVHNGGDDFYHCLTNATSAHPPPDEIIVVADGDSDGSWRLAEEFEAQVIHIPVAGGPAQARNIGAQNARGDILFFIDADVAIAGDAIGQLKAAFSRDPRLSAIFGSYDDQPAAANFLSQYKNLFHHYIHQTGQEDASTFWSGCGVIRRDVFLALGGFDRRYFRPCIEDIELGYRLKKAGHKIRLLKTLQAKHLKRWEAGSMLKADFFYRAVPWTGLILRDRGLINDLNLGGASRASIISVFALVGAWGGVLWQPWLVGVIIGLCLLLLTLNLPVYRFFLQKRGLFFTFKVVPWHWFYYFYGGLGFCLGTVLYLTSKWKGSTAWRQATSLGKFS